MQHTTRQQWASALVCDRWRQDPCPPSFCVDEYSMTLTLMKDTPLRAANRLSQSSVDLPDIQMSF